MSVRSLIYRSLPAVLSVLALRDPAGLCRWRSGRSPAAAAEQVVASNLQSRGVSPSCQMDPPWSPSALARCSRSRVARSRWPPRSVACRQVARRVARHRASPQYFHGQAAVRVLHKFLG